MVQENSINSVVICGATATGKTSLAANVAKKRMHDQTKYMQALEKALVAHPAGPRAPQIMFDLASAYEQQGRNTQAIEIYKRLIINHPTNKLASRAQGRLNRLQK